MFKRMQRRMTFYYALIISIIIITLNSLTYIGLTAYSSNQLTKDTTNLFNSIDENEWVLVQPSQQIQSDLLDEDDAYEEKEIEITSQTSDEDEDEDEKDKSDHGDEDSYDQGDTNKTTPILEDLTGPVDLNLQTPTVLRSFLFYYIYTDTHELVKYFAPSVGIDEMVSTNPMEYGEKQLIEIKNYDLNGDTLHLITMMSPIHYQGKTIGYVYIGKDISFAHETTESLLLIGIITSVIGILFAMILGYFLAGKSIKPIKEAYEVKQQFIADASHELRTPLSIIALSTEILSRDIPSDLDFSHQVIYDIKEESSKMNYLVEDLLMLARSDSGKQIVHKEWFQLDELIHKICQEMMPIANAHGIKLSYTNQEKTNYYGDIKLIGRLIRLLVENAIKYTPQDGSVKVSQGIYKKNSKGYCQITVSDTGIGISKSQLSKIFQRFYRVDAARNSTIPGHGLGLSIANEITQLHQGKIDVESEPEKGSVFKVTLPVESN